MKKFLIVTSLMAFSVAAFANTMSAPSTTTTAPSSSTMNSTAAGSGTQSDAPVMPSQQSMEEDEVDLKKTTPVSPSTAPTNQQRMEDMELEEEDDAIMYDDSRIDDIEEEEDVE